MNPYFYILDITHYNSIAIILIYLKWIYFEKEKSSQFTLLPLVWILFLLFWPYCCIISLCSGSVVTIECIEKLIKKDMLDPTNGHKLTEKDIIYLQRVCMFIVQDFKYMLMFSHVFPQEIWYKAIS